MRRGRRARGASHLGEGGAPAEAATLMDRLFAKDGKRRNR
jgi:hypothetical protein